MNHNYNKHINFGATNKTATLMLQSFFNPKGALISTPVFLINQGGKQVTVQLSYYLAPKNPVNNRAFSNSALKSLINALTHVYQSVTGEAVTVQLELVRQHRPYMDASILAQYLAINASKHGFNRMTNVLLNAVPYLNSDYVFNLSCITGVKVQLSGLLTSQRNRSRNSVYTASAGTFHTSHITHHLNEDLYTEGANLEDIKNEVVIDYSSYTSKSRLGSFTVKV